MGGFTSVTGSSFSPGGPALVFSALSASRVYSLFTRSPAIKFVGLSIHAPLFPHRLRRPICLLVLASYLPRLHYSPPRRFFTYSSNAAGSKLVNSELQRRNKKVFPLRGRPITPRSTIWDHASFSAGHTRRVFRHVQRTKFSRSIFRL